MASHIHCLTKAAFGPCTSLSKASKREKNKNHKKSTSPNKGTHHLNKDTNSVDKDTHNQQNGKTNEGEILKNIPQIKKQLRPLLDAIISVESDRMNRKEGCKGGTRIGMLEIDEQYHRDAWGPNASSYHWSQCRDTEYAENTVVVFWLRHCSDAVANNDWETLARIHNGGREGLGTSSTTHYWAEICRWLEQNPLQAPAVSEFYKNNILHTTVPVQSMTTFAERHTLADISNLHISNKDVTHTQKRQNGRQVWHMKKNNKQDIKDDVKESCTTILQTVQHISSNLKGKGTNHSCPRNRSRFPLTNVPFITEGTKSISVINRRRNSMDFGSGNNLLKVWKFSRSVRREKAAIVVQAYCRMFLIKAHYKRKKSAVLKIQRWWRQYGNKGILFTNYSTVQRMETVLQERFLHPRNQPPIIFSQIQDENEALPSNVDLLQSPADLLYKGNISAAEEEKVLTELANLLSPSDNNGLEQFNFFESGVVDEELGNFQFPFLQEGGESDKSTPVLTRIHSPRMKGTCISHEKNGSGDLENIMPEWLELRKSHFMEMDGGNTNSMPIQVNETFPDFVNIISERKQVYNTAVESVASSANSSHFRNCSDYWKEDYCSKKVKPGLGHSQFKTFCLDESPNASINDGTNEENTGEIWSRNISSMERKAGLLYRKLLGRLEVELKMSKVVPDYNSTKLIGLEFHRGFPREKEIYRAHEASLDDENVSKEIGVDHDFLGLTGNIRRLELCEHGNDTVVVGNPDPPLSVVAMFCCRFPEALFTSSVVALLCSEVHSRKQKVCSFSGVKEVENLSYGFYVFP